MSSTKLLTTLIEVALISRKLVIELASEIVGGVEGKREREEKDRETAEFIHLMEMEGDWDQEVEESVEIKAKVQLSRLLEEADQKVGRRRGGKRKHLRGKQRGQFRNRSS